MAKELYPEITLDLVRVTEAASLMSSLYLGFGNKEAVDGAAVDAMRGMLDYMDIKGTVIIGEGEKDEAPMLYYGEKVGLWDDDSIEMDIAVDPIDGTRLVAYGLPNALSVMVGAEKGKILNLPTFYASKLAVGPELKGKLNLNSSLKENIKKAAEILGLPISEMTIMVLNRERHRKMIDEIREIGARIKLIGDGDIAGAIATCMPESGVNMCVGIGGSPEAILAAAALRTLGGEIQIKIWPRDEAEAKKIDSKKWDLNRIYTTEELVGGQHVIFAATGVTDGDFLKGVKYIRGKAITESIVMRTSSETVRRITTYHDLKKKKIRIKSLDGDEKLININKVDDERTSILLNKLYR